MCSPVSSNAASSVHARADDALHPLTCAGKHVYKWDHPAEQGVAGGRRNWALQKQAVMKLVCSLLPGRSSVRQQGGVSDVCGPSSE